MTTDQTTDTRADRAAHELSIMLGSGVLDIPKVLRILEER